MRSSPMTNTILIVVDMQKDFVDGSLGTAEAQKRSWNTPDRSSLPWIPIRKITC